MVLLRPKTVLSVYSDLTFAGQNFRFLEEEVHETFAGTLDLFARGRWPALHLSGNEQTEGDKHRGHNKPAGPSIGTKAISESSDKCCWIADRLAVNWLLVGLILCVGALCDFDAISPIESEGKHEKEKIKIKKKKITRLFYNLRGTCFF